MIRQEEGTCPVCGSNDLEYDSANFETNVIMYPWVCINCGAQGDECYSMTFIEHENIEN